MGKSNNKGKAIATGVVCVLGAIFIVVLALQPSTTTPVYHVDSDPATPDVFVLDPVNETIVTEPNGTDGGTVYSVNRTVAIDGSAWNPASLINAGFIEISPLAANTLYINLTSGTSFPCVKFLGTAIQFGQMMQVPLYCTNGSSVVFKFTDYYMNTATVVTYDGMGVAFCIDETWWLTTHAISPSPAWDVAHWAEIQAALLALAD
jgi:hypothetical protein